MRSADMVLNGWGNYTPFRTRAYRPDRRRMMCELLEKSSEPSWIARGLGRSYGDSAINPDGGTLLFEQVNHMLDFDESSGTVTCEAGVTFAELIDVFLPRGWFLPVTPGTKFVTVGGAIAADVHGKNHHVDGTFGRFVESIDLILADNRLITCSPSENADIFWATIGGMGLTGVIVAARFRMMPVESAYVTVDYQRARNLDHAFDLFEQGDKNYRYSVAWIDCLARGDALGRCVLMRGNTTPKAELPAKHRERPYSVRKRRTKSIPVDFPGFLLNPWSVGAFNALYYKRHGDGRRVVDYDQFFYPLDGILKWNRLYGRRGFVQYQALFPPESSRVGMRALLQALAESRMASFLAVLKSTGAANAGLLSFPKPGYTLALDLPNKGRRLETLIPRLDALVLEHGGRLYLAKDATMSAETLEGMYDRLGEFRALRRRLDPGGRWSSAQARRLKLVEAS